MELSRRIFIEKMFGSLFTFALVKSLCGQDLLAGSIRPIAHAWILEMERMSKEMKTGKVQQREWQEQLESLLKRVEMSDLLAAIDYDRMMKVAVLPEDHESAEDLNFSRFRGMPKEFTFAPYFYAMRKDVAIVPHGHRNMTSMHMVLSGEAHAWQFDRVGDDGDYMLIKPTIDKVFTRGDLSTISDQKNNVHWFKALTGTVYMFNIGVFGINPSESFTGREYIDPLHGEKTTDGLIRARRMSGDAAYKMYGKS
jgi:hypothetical protein